MKIKNNSLLPTNKKIITLPEERKKEQSNNIPFTTNPEYYTLMSNFIVNENSYNFKQLSLFNTQRDNEFEIESKNTKLKIKISDILGEQILVNFNDTQAKIWDYILSQANFVANIEGMKDKLTIKLADLCDFLGLTFQTKNIEKLTNDLKLMSKIKIKFDYKGETIANLFEVNALRRKSELIIFLGVWFEKIKDNKELQNYMLINSKAYKENKTRGGGDSCYWISRKIHEIYKNNLRRKKEIVSKNGQYEIIITGKTFAKCLAWNEEYLKKNTKRQKGILSDILDKIQKEQKINYDIIECTTKGLNAYEKFLETKYIFYSSELEKAYQEKGYN